jgi:hypothetical protein
MAIPTLIETSTVRGGEPTAMRAAASCKRLLSARGVKGTTGHNYYKVVAG